VGTDELGEEGHGSVVFGRGLGCLIDFGGQDGGDLDESVDFFFGVGGGGELMGRDTGTG
jgi:hypothetical protein